MTSLKYKHRELKPPHRHNAHTSFYVLERTSDTQTEGTEDLILKADGTFYEHLHYIHMISRNSSPAETAKPLVFFIKNKAAPTTIINE